MPTLRLLSAIVLFAVGAPLPVLASGCTTPAGTAGDQIYNSISNTMQYCNGANWVNMGTTQGVGTLTSPDLCTTDGTVVNCTTQTVPVPNGGTGVNTLTAHGVLIGEGSSVMAATPAGTSNDLLQANGSSSDPTWTNTLTGVTLAGTTTLPGSGVITSSGNVGIGTTAPLSAFDILGQSNVRSGGLSFYSNTQPGLYATAMYKDDIGNSIALNIDTQNSSTWYNSLRIEHGQTLSGTPHPSLTTYYTTVLAATSGNVGIGSTSPQVSLDVNGAIAVPNNTHINFRNSGGALDAYLYEGPGASLHINASAPIDFDISGTTQAVVNSSGNVGIGTTSPNTTLDVRGNIYLGPTSDGTNTNQQQIVSDGSAASMRLKSHAGIFLQAGGTTNKVEVSSANTCESGSMSCFANNGNVGIGTTSPQATLDVSGYARLTLQSSQPVACSSTNQGAIALNHLAQACACNGTSWIFADSVGAACSW
jgi:hypothetical protein